MSFYMSEVSQLGHFEDIESQEIEIDSPDTVSWNNKGIFLGDMGKCEEAIRCFDKAIELDPSYTVALYNKGFALNVMGEYEDAIECYNKVHRMLMPGTTKVLLVIVWANIMNL
jgi:tetratricopeptide (TPR) repeat protein